MIVDCHCLRIWAQYDVDTAVITADVAAATIAEAWRSSGSAPSAIGCNLSEASIGDTTSEATVSDAAAAIACCTTDLVSSEALDSFIDMHIPSYMMVCSTLALGICYLRTINYTSMND